MVTPMNRVDILKRMFEIATTELEAPHVVDFCNDNTDRETVVRIKW